MKLLIGTDFVTAIAVMGFIDTTANISKPSSTAIRASLYYRGWPDCFYKNGIDKIILL
jgi:hypothetical protein